MSLPAPAYSEPESELESQYLSTPLGGQEPPSYTLTASGSRPAVPDYSCQPREDETFLDGTPITYSRGRPSVAGSSSQTVTPRRTANFTYRHKSLTIQLSSKSIYTQSPAYGRGEIIEGVAIVEGGLKSVEAVQLKIEGLVTTTIIDRGVAVVSTPKCVLNYAQPLYAPGQAIEQSGETLRLPFSFQLPTTVQGSNTPLPPSFYRLFATMEGSVRYTLRVDLFKKGLLKRNEKLEAVFLYLPKTSPPSLLPPSWYHYTANSNAVGPSRDVKVPIEAAGDRSQKEWKTIPITCVPSVSDLTVEFSLLKPLVYQAQTSIPFSLTLSYPNPILPDLILASAQVTLIKITTINVSRQAFSHEEIIGVAEFDKPDSPPTIPDDGRTVRVASGCVMGGKIQGEAAWSIPGFVEVQYVIQVDIKPSLPLDGVIPTCQLREIIELTTHSAEDADNFDGAMDGPALGIIGRLNTA